MKFNRSAILGLLGMLLPYVVQAQAEVPRPTVGVIRWDAWGGKDGVEGGEQTRVLEQTLKPEKYHFRLPWFAQVKADGSISLDGAAPGIMEREIDYAADAGLDYFIFLNYGPKSFKSRAFERFLAAKNSKRLKFAVCFMLYPECMTEADWDISVERHVKLMQHPQWLKVCGGRPLVLTFPIGNNRACHRTRFAKLRAVAKKAGIDPYCAIFNGGDPRHNWNQWSDYEAQGYSAVGSYALLGPLSNGRASYLDFARQGEDLLQGEAVRRGKACIAGFMTGWQKDPRKDYVPYWEKGHSYHRQKGFPDLPTPAEIAVEMQRTLDFLKLHPACCPANTIAIYAWNEHDEGGWLCPTWTPSGKPNTSRLDAIRPVLLGKRQSAVR